MPHAPRDDDELAVLRSRLGHAFEQAWAGRRFLAATAAIAYALHDGPADSGPPDARTPLRALVSSLRHRPG